jgi:NAD(P)-dependent dehydrogenase (short-subunit alcohol dehydrogenase family)
MLIMAAEHQLWDMRGGTVLVTGGTGGIGLATARALVRYGANVIITGRDAERGNDVTAALRHESGAGSVTFLQADHSTVGGNQQLADRVQETCTTGLDVLINNVGGLSETRHVTADGYETTLAMNLVGPFALTAELLPLLRTKAPSRCVIVTSAAFKMYKRDPFEDVQSTSEPFIGANAYAQTKVLNLLFELALARRLTDDQITVNMVHPGVTWTDMTRSQTWRANPSWRRIWPIMRLIMRHGSPDKAARRVAFLACAPDAGAHTGRYFERSHDPKRLSTRELDPDHQEHAYELGEQLVASAATRKLRS